MLTFSLKSSKMFGPKMPNLLYFGQKETFLKKSKIRKYQWVNPAKLVTNGLIDRDTELISYDSLTVPEV